MTYRCRSKGHKIRVSLIFILPQHKRCVGRRSGKLQLHTILYPCDYTLYWTAYFENWDAVIPLIAIGSDPNFRMNGYSVLSWAILTSSECQYSTAALLESLLSVGADPNWISDSAICVVLQWDTLHSRCLTDLWSQDTIDRAILLTGRRDLHCKLK